MALQNIECWTSDFICIVSIITNSVADCSVRAADNQIQDVVAGAEQNIPVTNNNSMNKVLLEKYAGNSEVMWRIYNLRLYS